MLDFAEPLQVVRFPPIFDCQPDKPNKEIIARNIKNLQIVIVGILLPSLLGLPPLQDAGAHIR